MATPNDMTLTNEFGEKTRNKINEVTIIPLPAQATVTVVANLTGSSAAPIAVTTQALANKMPAKAGVTSLTVSAVADAAVTAVADAPAAAVAYAQADVQAMVDLLNDLKAKYNLAVALIDDLKSKHNALLVAMKVVS